MTTSLQITCVLTPLLTIPMLLKTPELKHKLEQRLETPNAETLIIKADDLAYTASVVFAEEIEEAETSPKLAYLFLR